MPWPFSILTTTLTSRHRHLLLWSHPPHPGGVSDVCCQLSESEFTLWLAGHRCPSSYQHLSSCFDHKLNEKHISCRGRFCTSIDSVSFPHWPEPTKCNLPYLSRFQLCTSNLIKLDRLRWDNVGHQGPQGSKDLFTDTYHYSFHLFVPQHLLLSFVQSKLTLSEATKTQELFS